MKKQQQSNGRIDWDLLSDDNDDNSDQETLATNKKFA
jgi:hypothetical protein